MMKVNFFVLALVLKLTLTEGGLKQEEYGEVSLKYGKKLHESCQAKFGTDEKTIQNAREGNFAEDPKLKHYIACLWKSSGAIFENGTLNTEMVINFEPEMWKGRLINAYKGCLLAYDGEPGTEETFFKIVKCFYHLDPDKFVMW